LKAWNAFFIALPKCCRCILEIREYDDNFLCRHAIKWKLNVEGRRAADMTSTLQDAHYLFFASISKGYRFNQLQLFLVVYGLRSQGQDLGLVLFSLNPFSLIDEIAGEMFENYILYR